MLESPRPGAVLALSRSLRSAALRALAMATTLAVVLCVPAFGETPVKVMVLGSYHMDNPGRDLHNMEADDVLAPKRQKELEALVGKLAAFRPHQGRRGGARLPGS